MENYREHISRGIWFSLHTSAASANSQKLKEAYAHNFRNICNKMACSCEDHCSQMLIDMPPEDFFHRRDSQGRHIGCLIHSIRCHNMVNERLGKPLINEDEAIDIYMGDKIVGGTCAAPKEIKTNSNSGSSSRGSSSHSDNRSRYKSNKRRNSNFKLLVV